MHSRIMLFMAAVLAGGAAPAVAQHTHVPTPSTWTLNLKESDFGGGPAMKSDVQVITVDTEKRLVWADTMVDANGKTERTRWDGPEDGTMLPVKGVEGAKSNWNAATDSGSMLLPDGSSVEQKLTLSRDGKKQTMAVVMKDAKGKVYHQKWVYDRTR